MLIPFLFLASAFLAAPAAAAETIDSVARLQSELEQFRAAKQTDAAKLKVLEERVALLERELAEARGGQPKPAVAPEPVVEAAVVPVAEAVSRPPVVEEEEPFEVAKAAPAASAPVSDPDPPAAEAIKGLPGRGPATPPDVTGIAKGTLVVVVNRQNPVDDVSTAHLRDLLLKRARTWPNRTPVTLVLSDPDSDLFGRVASSVLHLSPLEFKASTMRRADRRINAASPQDLVGRVGGDPAAMAVVPVEFAAGQAGIKLLRVAGKRPAEEGYGF